MAKFRKKPVEIEAFQLTWKVAKGQEPVPEWFIKAMDEGVAKVGYTDKIEETQYAEIKTLAGTMVADAQDWIIQGVSGEIYPCKPDIFEKTYDAI